MLNDSTLRKYIVNQGGVPDNSMYLLKDDGSGNFIKEWKYQFRKPRPEELSALQLQVDSDRDKARVRSQLLKTDKDMARVVEDLVDYLGILDQLPQDVQDLINSRKDLRGQL